MRSATLSSKAFSWWNFTLFRKNLTRFWPIWALYGAAWLLLPLSVLSDARVQYAGPHTPVLYGILNPYGLLLAAAFGVLSAMAVFSYLYNSRSVNLMHSLPVRRECLFLTNYLSGLSFLIGPQLVVALLTLAAQAAVRWVDVGQVLLWFLMQTLFVLFFYSFAVFCAMFTGNLFALPVFYGILNGLAMGMSMLLNHLFSQFIYGFYSTGALGRAAVWLTPLARLLRSVRSDFNDSAYTLSGIPSALLYAAAGLVFAVLALAVYRRRNLESAGDVVSVSWVRPVFKYGVAFCSAVALGAWLAHLFSDLVPQNMYSMLLFVLLAGIAGYFTAEMLLRKSLKVFRRAWKGGAVFCAALVCAALVMDLDLIGFNRTPAREQIVSVSLSGISSSPRDGGRGDLTLTRPEDIDAVLALHQYLAEHRNVLQADLNAEHDYWETVPLADGGLMDVQTYADVGVRLEYELADGEVLSRRYGLPIRPSDLNDPGSPASLLTGLLNRNTQQLYFASNGIPEDASPVEANLDVYNTGTQIWENVAIEGEAARTALLAAVRSDMAAGRIGVRFLLDDPARYEACYTSNLSFSLFKYFTDEQQQRANWRLEISLQTTAEDTLACLRELDVLDETHIIFTHAEYALHTQDGKTETAEVYYDSVKAPHN